MTKFAENEFQIFLAKLISEGTGKIRYGKIRSYCDSNEEADKICGLITNQLGLVIIY